MNQDKKTRTWVPGEGRERHSGATADTLFERGARLGRYMVLETVGSGAMAHVYAAYDPELDRKVALKVLRADRLLAKGREQAQQRLRREAQAVAKLNHPSVVSIFDVGWVGGRLFVAMELIEGQTFRQWCATESRTWRQIVPVLTRAGRGLAAAHHLGLVHRDFKPNNLMVGDDGRVQVVDFGLVRILAEDGRGKDGHAKDGHAKDGHTEDGHAKDGRDDHLTATGGALGTPAYMAPEQQGGRAIDGRADQYSFCMVLFEALYGKLPNSDERQDPPAESAVPEWLRRVLRRGLATDPDARFASMDELLEALGHETRRHRRRWALAAALPVVLLAGFFFLREPRPCRGAEQRLVGIWDAPRKQSMRDTFLATQLPFAEGTWQRIEQAFDAYTDAWVKMHTEACEATHYRGEQSGEMLDRRMACLDDRLADLRALAEELTRGNSRVVERALPAAEGLANLALCADRRALAALVPSPRDPDVEARSNRVRAALAEARAQESTGQYTKALTNAEVALAEAREVPYRPLLGEAHFTLAVAQGRSRQIAEMRENLLEAVTLAQATRHDELLADATILSIINAYLRGAPDEGVFWGRLARSAIERLGERRDLEARRLFYLGVAHSMGGDHEQAITYFQTYLEAVGEATPLQRANALMSIGLAHNRAGRFEQALEPLKDGVDLYEASYGPSHVLLAKPLANLALLQYHRSHLDEAMALYQRALALYDQNLGPDHPEAGYVLAQIGWMLVQQDKAAEGVEYLRRALRLAETHPGDPANLARQRFWLARGLERIDGDGERIMQLARAARDSLATLGDRAPEDLAEVEAWIRQQEEAP